MGKIQRFTRPFQLHAAASMCRIPYVMERLHATVDPDLFDDAAIGDIVAFAVSHYKQCSELLTYASICEAFDNEEVRGVIEEMWDEEVTDPEFVVENVVDFVRQQSVERAVTEAASKIDRGEHDGIVDMMKDALTTGADFGDFGEFYHEDFDERAGETLNPQSVYRVRTGLSHLDDCLDGGLEPGELGVILAPPKTGKSFTLVNIGAGAASGPDAVNVVHYSLEMSPRKIHRRYDDRVAGRKLSILRERNPKLFIKKLRQRKKNRLPGEILVKGYGTRKATVGMLRAHLSLVKSNGFDFGMVLVDYGDIMRPDRRLGEMRHEQAGIYEDLRGLGEEFGVPVWTACLSGDTLIDTPRGQIPIEDLAGKAGHPVYSYDATRGQVVVSEIEHCWKSSDAAVVMDIELDNEEVVTVTSNHRFLKRNGEEIFAGDLVPGMSLMPFRRDMKKMKDALLVYNPKVVRVSVREVAIPVYDMEVRETHNFALAAGIVVHNSQANRASLNKKIVTMSDVAESFEKIAIADCVVALCRTEEEKVNNKGRLFIAALRENPMGRIIPCNFNLDYSTIRTLDIVKPKFRMQKEDAQERSVERRLEK